MGRNTGPKCKICRSEGEKLYLKGIRCHSDKCAIERKPYRPGEHGRGRRKVSEYGMRLREKQKVRQTYGINENQFRRYFEIADQRKGVTGENLLKLLESRLDNVIYRLGFATSRSEARQFIAHGHVLLNGRVTDIPSCLVSPGDVISYKDKAREMPRIREIREINEELQVPSWLEADFEQMQGRVLDEPVREEIDLPIREQLIVEYYSR